jgi:hypothetical protein
MRGADVKVPDVVYTDPAVVTAWRCSDPYIDDWVHIVRFERGRYTIGIFTNEYIEEFYEKEGFVPSGWYESATTLIGALERASRFKAEVPM